MDCQGGGHLGLAGASAAVEENVPVLTEEELLLPGVRLHPLNAEYLRRIEEKSQRLSGVHPSIITERKKRREGKLALYGKV
jgi:hypothetical protein